MKTPSEWAVDVGAAPEDPHYQPWLKAIADVQTDAFKAGLRAASACCEDEAVCGCKKGVERMIQVIDDE